MAFRGRQTTPTAPVSHTDLPPPPTWGLKPPDYDELVEAGMDAMLRKRYSEAHAAYEAALRLRPDTPAANTIRGNLRRLRVLMNQG